MYRPALALFAAACIAAPAAAQMVQRNFPANALRGAIVVGEAPAILLNGNPARLAPGARLRGTNNLSLVPTALLGARLLVHYTLDTGGEVSSVWVLSADEAARQPWPTTLQEVQTWSFDPVAQVWTKP